MKFDFDRVVDRKSTNDLKWRTKAVESYLKLPVREDMIPMWLADMDFACSPNITQAIKTRSEKEIFGYVAPQANYYNALNYWYTKHHDVNIDPSWVAITPSVLSGISISIFAFSDVGDNVIIQQPVYDPFFTIVTKAKRNVLDNELIEKDGNFYMDFDLLEKQAADPKTKLMILCSPHNPIGRVWTVQELAKVDEICRKHNIIVVSDEIHSDIVFDNHKHTTFFNVSDKAKDNTILCTSPAKTFNVAGLKISNIVIPNETLRKEFVLWQEAMSLNVKNTFGVEAVSAAYSQESEQWVSELLQYLQENIAIVQKAVDNMQGVSFTRPQGTFLCWLDFTKTGISDQELLKRVIFDAGIICVPGNWFGKKGECHLRLNIGCTKKVLTEALERIAKAIEK